MAASKSPLPRLFSVLSLFSVVAITPALSLSVHELFVMYGLPGGLLPDTVKTYTFSNDGQLIVHMESPCYIRFDYLVYYDHQISAKISNGSISNLKGIEVQTSLLWWLSVDEIRVHEDLSTADSIYFQVGIINKKLGISQFRAVQSCYTAKLPETKDVMSV